MENMNTLFKKGYLLAGVVMAANIFVANEVKASNNKNNTSIDDNTGQEGEEKKEERDKNASSLESVLNFVLSRENTINLIGGTVSSVANNYLKWWDYNPGGYLNLRIGCLGWRSKKLFDIVQVDINLNAVRGVSWVILGAYNCAKFIKDEKENIDYGRYLHVSFLVSGRFLSKPVFIGIFLIQGFVSAPLIFHISNFSIAISLDSILWAGIGKFLDLGKNNEINENENFDEEAQLLDLSNSNNNGDK